MFKLLPSFRYNALHWCYSVGGYESDYSNDENIILYQLEIIAALSPLSVFFHPAPKDFSGVYSQLPRIWWLKSKVLAQWMLPILVLAWKLPSLVIVLYPGNVSRCALFEYYLYYFTYYTMRKAKLRILQWLAGGGKKR